MCRGTMCTTVEELPSQTLQGYLHPQVSCRDLLLDGFDFGSREVVVGGPEKEQTRGLLNIRD